LSQSLNDGERITRIDSQEDLPGGLGRARRRLTAPGPTPLRSQTQSSDDGDGDEGDGSLGDEVTADEAMVALVPSQSGSSPTGSTTAMENHSPRESSESMQWESGQLLPSGLLFIKVVSMMVLCSPFLCEPRVLYPVLGLAGLDVVLPTSTKRTLWFFITHLIILFLASHLNMLCPPQRRLHIKST